MNENGYAASTRAVGTSLTTTSATTLYTANGGNMRERVNAIRVSNVTGTDATVTLTWTDAASATTFSIETGTTVPANGSIFVRPIDLPLSKDDTIKATAGTANALHVIVLLTESGRSS